MYKVEQRENKGKDVWVVITPDGLVANEYPHATPEKAEIHRRNCEAFGRKVLTVSGNCG